MADFYDPSPEIKAVSSVTFRKSKYPWRDVPIGKSFVIPDKDITWPSLLTLMRRSSARMNKTFKAYHHKSQGVYEIMCSSMREAVKEPILGQPALDIQPATQLLDEVRKMEE